jgi:hypothetical protein
MSFADRPRRDGVAVTWVHAPIDERWIGAFLIMVIDDRPVVAEARVFPGNWAQPLRDGVWSGEPSEVPAGGMPGPVLRGLKLATAMKVFEEFMKLSRDIGRPDIERDLDEKGFPAGVRLVPRRPGRAGRSDEYYAVWAAAYITRLRVGSRRPVSDLAADPPILIEGFQSTDGKVSRSTIHDIIHTARERGLLSASPKGQSGGELTAKGRELLAATASGRDGAERSGPRT